MWSSTSSKWIEGFITKEEAEFSLQGPRGVQKIIFLKNRLPDRVQPRTPVAQNKELGYFSSRSPVLAKNRKIGPR
jgi:hypothetical protein